MREPFALRWQTMFLLRVHLAECPVETVRTEKWIVPESFVATWRPDGDAIDPAFEFLNMAVRPGKTQRGHEMRAPLLGGLGTAFDQQGLDAVHRRPEILVRAGPPR